APRPGVPGPCVRFGARPHVRGDTLLRDPTAVVLWPPPADGPDAAVALRGDNAAALVLEVGDGRARALLMADADSVVESRLDIVHRDLLLKAGHHGARSSSGATFVARVRPERVAISSGAPNLYGHPHAEALARLASTGAAIDRTDREGALWY